MAARALEAAALAVAVAARRAAQAPGVPFDGDGEADLLWSSCLDFVERARRERRPGPAVYLGESAAVGRERERWERAAAR